MTPTTLKRSSSARRGHRRVVPAVVRLVDRGPGLEWVLRGFYELPAREIGRVLRALAGIEQVTLEDRNAVLSALDAFDKGLDFADALHLARSARASGLVTFERRLASRAQTLRLKPEVELIG